jgi:hypothetical protein
MKKLLFFIIALAFFSSCKQKIDEFTPNANGVDFSKFVAIGNSMTAGYADGALYTSGQVNSPINILANQLKTLGGGEFKQPLMGTEDGVGFDVTATGFVFRSKLGLTIVPDKDCAGNPIGTYSMLPRPVVENPDQNEMRMQLFAPPTVTGPYNNLGVPGATLQSIFYDRYGDPTLDGHPFNPYFVRFATNPRTTVLADAMVQQPTFFAFWLGNNDVLGSALAGTDVLVTKVDTFAKYYNIAIGALLASGKSPKGVLGNIPDVTSIPYFSTISQKLPYNSVTLDSTQAAGLNTLYAMYGHPEITWHAGPGNAFVITTTTGQWTRMEEGDQFLMSLPTDSIKCKGMGIADQSITPIPRPYPIPGKYVLQMSEIQNLQNTVSAYNSIIANVAASKGLALVDMNAKLKTMVSGMIFDGVKFNTQFVVGGTFSTDGIHGNPRGNAIMANFFIQAINAKYGCTIPEVSVTDYHGLVFP